MNEKESIEHTGGESIEVCQWLKYRIFRELKNRQYKGTSPLFD